MRLELATLRPQVLLPIASFILLKVRKRANIRNRCNQVPHLTQDITWESDKHTIGDLKRETKYQPCFPAGDHKTSINRRARNHNKHKTEIPQMIHKRSVKTILLEGFNRFHGANLTFISGVDQDTGMFGLHGRS